MEMGGTFVPWFLESEWSESATVVDDERLELPADFIQEIEDQVVQFKPDASSRWKTIPKKRADELEYLSEDIENPVGFPRAYSLQNNYFIFAPTPDQIYPIRMKYFKRDVPFNLVTDENKWLRFAADWLMAETGQILAAQHLHDDELAVKFQMQVASAKQRVYTMHEAREHANRNYRSEG